MSKENNKLSFENQLLVEGINSMGYGILPKYVMLDPDLTIEAKTIYSYFCSFAGSGNTAFPSRGKILSDLQITKDTYYKHFRMLVNQGYITVEQSIGDGARFGNNIYTLISNPKKFQEQPSDNNHTAAYSRIRVSGLKANGYGTIPKTVMVDERLPLKAKGIYAYFCGFTGGGNSAFPKKDDILHHLRISHGTYEKFYRLLISLNYIEAKQRHVNGRLSVNDYYLIDNPRLSEVELRSTAKKKASCNSKKANSQKKSAESSNIENSDTNINNTTINNSEVNQSLKKQAVQKSQTIDQPKDRMSEEDKKDLNLSVWHELIENQELPYYYNSEPAMMEEAIHIMTEWETFYPNGYNNELDQNIYNIFNIALIEMCCAKEYTKVKNANISYAKVIDKINELAKFENSCIDISEFAEPAMDNFKKAVLEKNIKKPVAYMKSCIWDAMLTGNLSFNVALGRYAY